MSSAGSALRRYAGPVFYGCLIFAAFAFAVLFVGFDKPYFAPALVLIACAAWTALAPGFRRGWAFPSRPPALALFLFIWWLCLSMLWTRFPNVSMIFCMTIGAMPILFFSITQNARAWSLVKAGRIALVAACAVLSVWAIVQFFFLSGMAGSRIHHPMLNPNNLAVVLVMSVFMLLPVFANGTRRGQIVSGGLIVLIVFAVMTTQSRGGALGLCMGLAVFGTACFPVVRERWKSFGGLLLAVGVAAAIYFPIIAHRVAGEIHLIGGADAAASTEARYYLWEAGYNMFRDSPFLGTGLGTFYLIFPRFREFPDFSDGYFLHVDPIQFGIETGFPATLLFYGFALAVLLFTVRALRTRGAENGSRVELACGFGGLLGLLLNAHVDYDLYMLPAEMMAAFLLSALYLGGEEILGRQRLTLSLRKACDRVFLVPLLFIVLLGAPVWVSFAGVAVYFDGKAAVALTQGETGVAAKYAGLALTWGPRNYGRAYYMDSLWRGQILQKRFYALEPEAREDLFRKALERTNQALTYNPYDIQALNTKALLYFAVYPRLDPDGLDHAREALEQARAIDPVNFDVRMGLAKVYDMLGRPVDAAHTLEEGLRYDLARRYVPAQYFMMLSELKRKLGHTAEADAFAKKAIDRNQEAIAVMKSKGELGQWLDAKIDALLQGW